MQLQRATVGSVCASDQQQQRVRRRELKIRRAMMAVAPGADGELPGCAPHTSTSKTTEYFLKPGHASGKEAIDLCEREAAVFAQLAGDHRIPDGAMCICNPVREPRRPQLCALILSVGPSQPITQSPRLHIPTKSLSTPVPAGLPAHLRQRDVLQANWVLH